MWHLRGSASDRPGIKLAEVGKVSLKTNNDEVLSDEFPLKSNGDEALNDDFPQKVMAVKR